MRFIKFFSVIFISSCIFYNFCNAETIPSETTNHSEVQDTNEASTVEKIERNKKAKVEQNIERENPESERPAEALTLRNFFQSNRLQEQEQSQEQQATAPTEPPHEESTRNRSLAKQQKNPEEKVKKTESTKNAQKSNNEKEKTEKKEVSNSQPDQKTKQSSDNNSSVLPDSPENAAIEFSSKMPVDESQDKNKDKTEYILKGLISMALVIAGAILLVIVIITGVNGRKKSIRNRQKRNYYDEL